MTLQDALLAAILYWNTRKGSKVMESRATISVTILGATRDITKLTHQDALKLLIGLAERGLSRKSQGDYYATLRRVLALNGVPTPTWPKAPEPERHTRDPISSADASRVLQGLRESGYDNTADWGTLLHDAGIRDGIEGLTRGALRITGGGDGFILLHVTGKGGHERIVPVVSVDARAILEDAERLEAIYRTPYRTHLDRWTRARKASGVKSRLASPHSLRHNYATRVLEKSGGNLRLVQELLGHANPGTTARYAEVSTASKVKAILG